MTTPSDAPSEQRRRELTEAYLRTPRQMGVYRIRNTVTGFSHVATSTDLPARFNRHRMELKMGSDRAPGLQAEWNRHGPDAFEFEILDLLEPSDEPGWNPREDLATLEALWRETHGDGAH